MGAWRFLIWTLLFLGAICGLGASLFSLVAPIFISHLWLNSFIALIWGVGLVWGVYFLIQISLGTRVLNLWKEDAQGFLKNLQHTPDPSVFLRPVTHELREGNQNYQETQVSLQETFSALFDTTHSSLRYLMGGLVFLGLLGTFWGLSLTIQGISEVMTHLSISDTENGSNFFTLLQTSLQKPLKGMGTAFGASLFGITASLILGFIDVQLTAAETYFFKELNAFLTTLQKGRFFSSFASSLPSLPASVPFSEGYMETLWGHLTEHLEKFQQTIHMSETGRRHLHEGLHSLTDKLNRLTDQMRTEQSLLLKLAEGQLENTVHLKTLVQALQMHPFHESLTWHISELDQIFTKTLHMLREHQAQATEEIRQELRLLTKTLGHTMASPPYSSSLLPTN